MSVGRRERRVRWAAQRQRAGSQLGRAQKSRRVAEAAHSEQASSRGERGGPDRKHRRLAHRWLAGRGSSSEPLVRGRVRANLHPVLREFGGMPTAASAEDEKAGRAGGWICFCRRRRILERVAGDVPDAAVMTGLGSPSLDTPRRRTSCRRTSRSRAVLASPSVPSVFLQVSTACTTL